MSGRVKEDRVLEVSAVGAEYRTHEYSGWNTPRVGAFWSRWIV